MNIKEAIDFGKKYLDEKNIEDGGLKSRIILSKILDLTKENLIIHDSEILSEKQELKYKEYLVRLSSNEPIQYITNYQEFMKLPFYVDNNVLIPQPDTEILVEEVINNCNEKQKVKILDICTGSGAIAISLAYYLKNAEVFASDISDDALKIAKENANKNKVEIKYIQSNLFESIFEKNFDIIVSNPPYIESESIEYLSEEVKKEPRLALDGGIDGLDFYKIIADNSKKYLKENGILALEIGYNQKEKVKAILEMNNYKNIKTIKDLSGNDRVIICNK